MLSAPELHALGFKVVLYSTPTLFLMQRALQEWLPKLQHAHDLRAIAPASVNFGDFQGYIENTYRERIGAIGARGDATWVEDDK